MKITFSKLTVLTGTNVTVKCTSKWLPFQLAEQNTSEQNQSTMKCAIYSAIYKGKAVSIVLVILKESLDYCNFK